jgi:hypothetical protein
MDPFAATAVLLFLLGAAASGYCLGRLLGRPSGFAVALFYLTVLFHVSTESGLSFSSSQVRAGTGCRVRNALDAGSSCLSSSGSLTLSGIIAGWQRISSTSV